MSPRNIPRQFGYQRQRWGIVSDTAWHARWANLAFEGTEGLMDEMTDDLLVERVRTERELRNLSVRAAVRRTQISNTPWSRWENEGGPPSPTMRKAVADAFGWPADWPENPPAVQRSRTDPDVLEELHEIRQQLNEMMAGVDASVAERQRLLRTVVKGVTLLTMMEARQRRAFDLLGLDPAVDLDDSRLDDPSYRATLKAQHQAGRARPSPRRRSAAHRD
jgi:transcriptional regulator with XRE-family HTH domain